MGTLYGGSAQTREGLEAWLGYALEAYRFLEKNTPRDHRWLLTKFSYFCSRGEVFVVYSNGKLGAVGIGGLVTEDLLLSQGSSRDVVERWGAGHLVFVPLVVVGRRWRGINGRRMIRNIIESMERRYPGARILYFSRHSNPNATASEPIAQEAIHV